MDSGLRPTDCPCSKEELELFKGRDIQTVMEKSSYADIYPLNNVSSSGPIEFLIQGSTDEYLDLNDTHLLIKYHVTIGDDAPVTATDNVAPINNFLNSMFADISLKLGDTVVEGGNFMYSYKSYLTNLLTYSKDSKDTQLAAAGWLADEATKMDAADNASIAKRRSSILNKNEVELYGALSLDTFSQSKYMINALDIRLKLTRNKSEFMFLSFGTPPKKPVLHIDQAILYVRRSKIVPSLLMEHESALSLQNAIYPLQHTEMTTYSISNGVLMSNKEALFRGHMPKLLIIGMVDNRGYNGTYNYNPFNFQHFDVNSVALYREGESIPGRAFTPDFDKKRYSREYIMLYHAFEQFRTNDTMGLTMEEFANGHTLFAFNLCPDQSLSINAQPFKTGNLRLELKFAKQLAESINVIALGLFDNTLEVTKTRRVEVDFKS